MNVTPGDIVQGLTRLGVRSGVPVLVHSSLRSFGHVEGGAQAVIEAVVTTVGLAGTVVVPALTGRATDGPESPPHFDCQQSPCWTGIIPETLRKLPGALRSVHPTHSVAAVGRLAEWLGRDHFYAATPCGVGTPYARIAAEGGQVIMFGCDFNSCTMVHGLEETAGVPYHMQSVETLVEAINGAECLSRPMRLHNWDHRIEKDFNRLHALLEPLGAVRTGRIGQAATIVVDAERLWALGVSHLIAHPWFFVTHDRRPSVQSEREEGRLAD